MSDINFIEVDSEKIVKSIILGFETEIGEPLAPGDERRLFLYNLSPIIVALLSKINDTGRQNLLRYARDVVLDAMGGDRVPRLAAQKAVTTFKYTLSAAQAGNVAIPKGSKANPDGKHNFEIQTDLIIPAGQTSGIVQATAMEVGSEYNGFIAGQIKYMVTPIQYVASVENTTESSGGADIESDDAYRERIRQAPESYSTAGPEGAYIYWAMSADSTIIDVYPSSPTAGVVKIIVLCTGGAIPTQAILDKVLAAVSAKDRRPLTDNVQVAAPTTQAYNINFTYYISTANKANETNIRSIIEGAGGVIDQYKSWQCAMLGRAINPDELRYRVMAAGASRLVITAPTYAALTRDKVAAVGTVAVTYGGLE